MENRQEPIWFEGSPLPHPDYAVDESGEVDVNPVLLKGQGQLMNLKKLNLKR